MHETAGAIRYGPAVNESCANPLYSHTELSQQNPKKVPKFLLSITFKDEPKVLQCPSVFSF